MDIAASAPDIQLNTYFAVQMTAKEAKIHVVEAVCQMGKSLGLLFRRIEALDTHQMGAVTFLRLRSDLPREEAAVLLQKLLEVTGRAVIVAKDGKFEARFPPNIHGGKVHPVSMVTMISTVRGTGAMFRGPKIKNWELAFRKQEGE